MSFNKKIIPISIGGAALCYVAAAFYKGKDWKSTFAIMAGVSGGALTAAVASYFLVPKTADEAIAEDKPSATVKKELSQADADAIAKKISDEGGKRYKKAPVNNPIVELLKQLKDGGYDYVAGKAVKTIQKQVLISKPVDLGSKVVSTVDTGGIAGGLIVK